MTALKQKIIDAAAALSLKRAELAIAEQAFEALLEQATGNSHAAKAPKEETERAPTKAVLKLRREKPAPNAGKPLDGKTGGHPWRAKGKPGRGPGPVTLKILEALRASPRAMNAVELQTAASASMGGVYYALERLTESKQVKRASESGFFELVEQVARAS